jgi:molybdenum-dependent DNA-binding transcriptional regulator ModE
MSAAARVLPLRVGLGAGEAIDSWLLRLAHRNRIPARWLLPTLGMTDLPAPWRTHALLRHIPAAVLRRVETQAGLVAHALDTAVLDRYEPLGWQPTTGSRYCTSCLANSGGQWPIRWRLPHVFACTRHRCLLAAVCPGCARAPLSSWSRRSGLAPPHRCTIRVPHGEVCGADLLTHPITHLRAGDPRLTAQEWINSRLDGVDRDALDGGVCTDLRDLDAVSAWFSVRTEPDAVRHLGAATADAVAEYRSPDQHNPLRRHRPTAAVVAAAFAVRAVGLLTATDDATRYTRFVPLFSDTRPELVSTPAAPMILPHKRMARLSELLQRRVLAACDPHLPASERLRHRTCTPAPAMPDRGSASLRRAQHIPQYLWPDWIIRLQPGRGAYVDTLATDLTAALLLPGNHIRNRYATAELSPWTGNTSQTLRLLGEHHRDALTAICALAQYLDTHGAPIDYRRRRATFTDATLTRTEWHDLCYQADADPGKGARQVHARRYLFTLLTGADLTDPRHRLTFRGSHDKSDYLTRFHRWLATPLRDVLHDHARGLLAAAGIHDEPLTWSPPADCVAGFILPGRDPDDIDLDTLHRLVTIEQVSLTTAAQQLGVSIDHVRYALQQATRPPTPVAANSITASRRLRDRADTLLTHRYFQQHYVRDGKTLYAIEADTGIPRKLIAEYARRLGIRLRGRRPEQPIDPGWLREQAETRRRTNGEIAVDLGVTHETIRRRRKDLGIRAGRSGVHRQQLQRYPHLPGDVRRAVERTRHGWQRLHRFQQIVTYPSINAAATALGLFQQNVFLQLDRLEADIGAALIHRTRHRYQPMTMTARGRRLLDHLDRPEVRQLLDQYAAAPQSIRRGGCVRDPSSPTTGATVHLAAPRTRQDRRGGR